MYATNTGYDWQALIKQRLAGGLMFSGDPSRKTLALTLSNGCANLACSHRPTLALPEQPFLLRPPAPTPPLPPHPPPPPTAYPQPICIPSSLSRQAFENVPDDHSSTSAQHLSAYRVYRLPAKHREITRTTLFGTQFSFTSKLDLRRSSAVIMKASFAPFPALAAGEVHIG